MSAAPIRSNQLTPFPDASFYPSAQNESNLKTAGISILYLTNTQSLQELLNTAITTLLYLIAVIVQFCSIGPAADRNITAGVFGVFNMLTYAVGSFYLYRDWKDSHPHTAFTGSVLKRNP
ncbi:hypothetical protein E2C01_029776 [Portunus trituberculatus]|uniref:MARVEL domain-containing protein n=1 Tax=Portunus trituberculatus TaxID=210409 RepID=A0A5B7EP84_PORTR|nr:hypothetical protein [Portunus trituberculatus]